MQLVIPHIYANFMKGSCMQGKSKTKKQIIIDVLRVITLYIELNMTPCTRNLDHYFDY